MMLLLLLACGSTTTPDACNEQRPCDWGQTCVLGSCVDTECATSAQCPVETTCVEGSCLPGCRAEADCRPGDTCDLLLQECVPAGCQDTHIDCGFAEYCDTTTGTCFDAGEQFCRPCERDSQCGDGNICYADYCGVDCNDRDCPSGFDCLPIRNPFGDIETFQCIAPCWLAP